jgi:hypothetical protein
LPTGYPHEKHNQEEAVMLGETRQSTQKQLILFALSTALAWGCTCPISPCFVQDGLISEATGRARELDSNAIVFQVSGVNGECPCIGASRTVSRTFLAIDIANANVTYSLTYEAGNWSTDLYPFPTLGAGYYDLRQVAMTEAEARCLLRDAGYGDDFHGWSLNRPLYPSTTPAQYTFNYGDTIVTIDTETKAVTAATPALGTPPLAGAPGGNSVSLQMIADADAKIKQTDPAAIIIWAGGRIRDGSPLNTPDDTSVWDFIAVSQDNDVVSAWQLCYDGAWTVQPLAQPPFNIVFQDLLAYLGMDVVDAWALAVNAGFDPPFSYWEVFEPLNPHVENIIYVFPREGGFVIVDSVTGEVHHETNTCVTNACYGH